MLLDKKHYTIVEKTFKYNRYYFIVKNKFTINCIGGEKMNKEQDELVFIDVANIPKPLKGKTGRNWEEIFSRISEGQAVIIPESYGTGATIRQAVKSVNEKLKKETYFATQRTENKKTVVYVLRK